MRYLVCLFIMLALLAGCKSSSDDKGTNPDMVGQIWPLKIGNQWTYENRTLDSAGNLVSADTSVILVVKDTVIQSETWHILTLNGERDPEMEFVTIKSDGLWQGGASGHLMFKYPAAEGDTWMVGTDTFTVLFIGDTITVPAGKFGIVNYKWKGSGEPNRLFQHHYFSPGVGWIMGEEFYRAGDGIIYAKNRNLLLSYELK